MFNYEEIIKEMNVDSKLVREYCEYYNYTPEDIKQDPTILDSVEYITYIPKSDSVNIYYDFGYELVEIYDLLYDVADFVKNYFDYEALGRDMILGGDWIETDNYFILND